MNKMDVFPALLGVRVLIGWVLYHPIIIIIHNDINTRYLDVKKSLLRPKKKTLTTPVHYNNSSKSDTALKATLNE